MGATREPRESNMRARIGIVIPSSCRRVEQDLIPALPHGVFGHIARLRMTGPYHASLEELTPRLVEAAGMLADADCDLIVFNCTSSSMSEGSAGEQQVVEAMQTASGRPVITAGGAVRAAMRAVSSKRVALATPYSPQSTERVANFIRSSGVEVVKAMAMHLPTSDASCGASEEYWMDVIRELAETNADTLFMSCANINTFRMIGDVEEKCNRRMITTNQAILWYALQQLGLDSGLDCLGLLGQNQSKNQAVAA